MQGWISLHRQITENEFYFAEKFTKMHAWIDLLILANHKPATIYIRGLEIKLNEGDLAYSQLSLAKRWKWNFKTVKKFLQMLEQRKMIKVSGGKLTTVISIINYSKYQKNGEQISAYSGEQNKPENKGQSEDFSTSDGEQNGEKMENRMENRMETDNNVNNGNNDLKDHDHAFLKKDFSKTRAGNWRNRKRKPNETVFISKEEIQKHFSREINQRDIDEINNIAEEYGRETILELFSKLTDKIYSTKIWKTEKIEALSMELIMRKNIAADRGNSITEKDIKNADPENEIIKIAKETMGMKTAEKKKLLQHIEQPLMTKTEFLKMIGAKNFTEAKWQEYLKKQYEMSKAI